MQFMLQIGNCIQICLSYCRQGINSRNSVNLTRYCIYRSIDWGKSRKFWIHERHPISRPRGRAIGRLLLGFWKNINCVITAPRCICSILFVAVILPTPFHIRPCYNESRLYHRCLQTFSPLWRHQMETFFALLAFCVENSPVTGECPSQRPVTRIFDDFFDLRLNKRFSKQKRRRWFEKLSRSL